MGSRMCVCAKASLFHFGIFVFFVFCAFADCFSLLFASSKEVRVCSIESFLIFLLLHLSLLHLLRSYECHEHHHYDHPAVVLRNQNGSRTCTTHTHSIRISVRSQLLFTDWAIAYATNRFWCLSPTVQTPGCRRSRARLSRPHLPSPPGRRSWWCLCTHSLLQTRRV